MCVMVCQASHLAANIRVNLKKKKIPSPFLKRSASLYVLIDWAQVSIMNISYTIHEVFELAYNRYELLFSFRVQRTLWY